MLEAALSWLMLIIGISEEEPVWFIAGAIYSVAAYLDDIRKK